MSRQIDSHPSAQMDFARFLFRGLLYFGPKPVRRQNTQDGRRPVSIRAHFGLKRYHAKSYGNQTALVLGGQSKSKHYNKSNIILQYY